MLRPVQQVQWVSVTQCCSRLASHLPPRLPRLMWVWPLSRAWSVGCSAVDHVSAMSRQQGIKIKGGLYKHTCIYTSINYLLFQSSEPRHKRDGFDPEIVTERDIRSHFQTELNERGQVRYNNPHITFHQLIKQLHGITCLVLRKEVGKRVSKIGNTVYQENLAIWQSRSKPPN